MKSQDHLRIDRIYSNILGHKKVEIINFICENANEDGYINLKISDIANSVQCTKCTVINTFTMLKQKGCISRVKNGLYKLL